MLNVVTLLTIIGSQLCDSQPPLNPLPDIQRYSPNTTVNIFIDWETFKSFSGVSEALKAGAQIGIEESAFRWSSFPNAKIRMRFAGFRSQTTTPALDELVIRMLLRLRSPIALQKPVTDV